MARRQHSEAQAAETAVPTRETSEPVGAVPLASTGPAQTYKPRVSVPLNEDGSFDLSSIRGGTADKLKEAIRKTPDLFPQEQAASGNWALSDCRHAYRILGEIEKWIAEQSVAHCSKEAAEVWEFSEQEVSELADPTCEVLNKYLGGVAGPESRLILALLGVHIQKYIAFRAMLALHVPQVIDMPSPVNGAPVPEVKTSGTTARSGSEAWQVKN